MKSEYWLVDIIEKKGDVVFVSGSITDGVLHIGAIFTSIADPVFNADRSELRRENIRSVSLKVEDMVYLGVHFPEMQAGVGPGLWLSGSGIELIKPNVLLISG